jgi:hypothetical protein
MSDLVGDAVPQKHFSGLPKLLLIWKVLRVQVKKRQKAHKADHARADPVPLEHPVKVSYGTYAVTVPSLCK